MRHSKTTDGRIHLSRVHRFNNIHLPITINLCLILDCSLLCPYLIDCWAVSGARFLSFYLDETCETALIRWPLFVSCFSVSSRIAWTFGHFLGIPSGPVGHCVPAGTRRRNPKKKKRNEKQSVIGYSRKAVGGRVNCSATTNSISHQSQQSERGCASSLEMDKGTPTK